MKYIEPGKPNSILDLREKYGNFINGTFIEPIDKEYYTSISPINGSKIADFPRSNEKDLELALDAAHSAFKTWSKTSAEERANLLLEISKRIEENSELLAVANTWDNGKPIRESLGDDVSASAAHFKYFASCIRAQEGTLSVIDPDMTAFHYYEPIGVVGQIIPWNFPILMAAWKLAPALAAGNCVILKPAEPAPLAITILIELIEDILPAGVLNILHGQGDEIGEYLASSKRIGKISFTGSTRTGRKIMHHAAENIIPSTMELGGKSPNIFFADIKKSESLYKRAVEGAALAFYNKGEVCTCPSRILVEETFADEFIEKLLDLTEKIKHGDPLDTNTVLGPQISKKQYDKILNYIEIAKKEGGKILIGGDSPKVAQEYSSGFYINPTLVKGTNNMQVFQEEIFGPVACLTTFKTEEEAIALANDTIYGLCSGLWTKDINRIHRVSKAIRAGRVQVNNYHACPDHSAFGGYKQSGIGRETHKMALESYQLIKNVLITYDEEPLDIF